MVGINFQIREKIEHLDQLLENLQKTWEQRRVLYEQNLDLLVSVWDPKLSLSVVNFYWVDWLSSFCFLVIHLPMHRFSEASIKEHAWTPTIASDTLRCNVIKCVFQSLIDDKSTLHHSFNDLVVGYMILLSTMCSVLPSVILVNFFPYSNSNMTWMPWKRGWTAAPMLSITRLWEIPSMLWKSCYENTKILRRQLMLNKRNLIQ